jgi:hypothetical protein
VFWLFEPESGNVLTIATEMTPGSARNFSTAASIRAIRADASPSFGKGGSIH